MGWNFFWAAGGEPAQPPYYQFDHKGCWVGCGPVAWTMLFGWADHQAGTGNTYWAPRFGLYRRDGGYGADEVAPLKQTPGIENVIREIRGHVRTFCAFGSGATLPWDMPEAWRYLSGRTGTRMRSSYNSYGIPRDDIRDRAIESIVSRQTPAVIGTGWLSHYPLAYAYAWQRRTVRRCFIFCWTETVTDTSFGVNQGGGNPAVEWVPASTWFSGEIFPY